MSPFFISISLLESLPFQKWKFENLNFGRAPTAVVTSEARCVWRIAQIPEFFERFGCAMCQWMVARKPGRPVDLHNKVGRMGHSFCALFFSKMLDLLEGVCYSILVKGETPQDGGALGVIAT